MLKLLAFYLILLVPIFFVFPFGIVHAQENNQFITIVNPVRISSYTPNPAESVRAQYFQVWKNQLPATWLLTYDALNHEGVFSVVNSMNKDQELGIFLEVTPQFAKVSKVKYNESSWHHANTLFLSGYTQQERKQLIDTVFAKFFEKFGYYPASVGAWWVDSFSLSYMKQKYNITANLTLADQFATDGYQVWGQYWSTPFYPSRYHAGVPAATAEVKLDLVNIQWAPRDPLNGYKNSLYSTQDYSTSQIGLDINFFEKLINLYGAKNKNEFGQITVGLEGDLPAGSYKEEFTTQMRLMGELKKNGKFETVNMKKFSAWYRKTYPELSPSQVITTNDFLGKKVRVVWYQSPRYRVGLIYNYESGQTKIFDFRTYHQDLQEPYYLSPNGESELSVYLPSIFDEVQNSEDVWTLDFEEISSITGNNQEFTIKFTNNWEIVFNPEKISIKGDDLKTPKILSDHPALKVVKRDGILEVTPLSNWIAPREGNLLRGLTVEASHFLAQKRIVASIIFAVFVLIGFIVFIVRSKLTPRFKISLISIPLVFSLTVAVFWYYSNSVNYYISQGEIDALFRLSVLPQGKVLVYDHECLQCSYHTPHKPAVFGNKRKYVEKYSKKPIVYNSSVFEAKTQEAARKDFAKLDAKYIYLTKFENYVEIIPFSPGDLGIEKIYANANGQIWRTK